MLQNGSRRLSRRLRFRCCLQQAVTPVFRQYLLAPNLKLSGARTLTSTFTPFTTSASSTLLIASNQNLETANDTIYALSTGLGVRAGIAIVRISGPACVQIYNAICPSKCSPKARYATVRTLRDPSDHGVILDSSALTLFFPGPRTVTGEDVLELHIHGGPATVKAVLSAIPRCSPNTRIAEPGEFTRRAFENGRLDLAQVEALSDTLAAETEEQRRAAVRGHSRRLGQTYDCWREQLTYARGELEALIDFSEDQHFDESPTELLDNVSRQVREMAWTISNHEYASHRGDLLRRGVEIALIGPPNAGKSSLLNLIVGREASIVSSEAGTTRDIVEVRYDIGGYLCTFADTAGLRKSSTRGTGSLKVGDIEQEGIRRAKARAQDANLIVVLISIEEVEKGREWKVQFDPESISDIYSANEEFSKPALIVVNKCDSAPKETVERLIQDLQLQLGSIIGKQLPPMIGISCLEATNPTNISQQDPGNILGLTRELKKLISSMTDIQPDSEHLLGVTERQRQLLSACKEHLNSFLLEAGRSKNLGHDDELETDIVVAAEHLRFAADCLSRITGRGLAGDVEEVLGVVFEKFCVGK